MSNEYNQNFQSLVMEDFAEFNGQRNCGSTLDIDGAELFNKIFQNL